MIISNSRRFIFVHVLKTGGTTVCAALDPFLRWNDVVLGGTEFGERMNGPYRERFGLRKHSTAQEIRAVVGDATWSSFFTFAFVRHPYARAVSFYRWLGRTLEKHPEPTAPQRAWPSMQAFVESRDFSGFIRHEKFLTSAAALSQCATVGDEAGRVLVDFVGRLEDLESGMRTVSERLGLDLKPLGRHNPSGADRPVAELLSRDEDFAYLERLYLSDFAAFGYDPTRRFTDSE